MDKKQVLDLWPDYVLGQLPENVKEAIDLFLENNPETKAELADWDPILKELDSELKLPSKNMDIVFYENLQNESGTQIENRKNQPKVFRLQPWLIGIAASIVLVLGFFLGKGWNSENLGTGDTLGVTHEELKAAEQETNDVRTQLVMSLADQPSATKRLEALSEVKKLDSTTDKVIEALFKMLNTDPNVNVRLAAVTSLSKYVENPIVREGLVMSITQQESPLVQIALAELMVTLKEQKSINSMETLLKKPNINEAVKEKLEESIKEII